MTKEERVQLAISDIKGRALVRFESYKDPINSMNELEALMKDLFYVEVEECITRLINADRRSMNR